MIKFLNKVCVEDGQTFKDHTLFLSAVSVGNVGQLAVDVILSNTGPPEAEKIGRIFHPGIEPVVGTDPVASSGDSTQLVTSCEIFRIPEKKYVVVHFHAPVTMKRRSEFVEFFCQWIKRQNFKQVICFSSTFASDRNDQQLAGVPLRFIGTANSEKSLTDRLKMLEWEHLEKRQFPAPAVLGGDSADADNESGILHMPGSGITKHMYEKCQEMDIAFLALIMFASEGDNTPEALTMFETADKLFNFIPDKMDEAKNSRPINVPLTWSHFQGRSHPVELY